MTYEEYWQSMAPNSKRKPVSKAEQNIPEGYEMFDGRLKKVKNPDRSGWWRFHDHYDRDGYCDNPGRGY